MIHFQAPRGHEMPNNGGTSISEMVVLPQEYRFPGTGLLLAAVIAVKPLRWWADHTIYADGDVRDIGEPEVKD